MILDKFPSLISMMHGRQHYLISIMPTWILTLISIIAGIFHYQTFLMPWQDLIFDFPNGRQVTLA
jgi:hypothetical protein